MPSAAPLSIWDLFQHADFVVKLVMIGLLIASVAVWAITIDKFLLYSRTRRAMDSFEQAFWSGQSLEELYRSLASRPTHSMAALFVAASTIPRTSDGADHQNAVTDTPSGTPTTPTRPSSAVPHSPATRAPLRASSSASKRSWM